MNRQLTVTINGNIVLKYDKHSRLPGHQRRFLDQMDSDMDRGIRVDGELIAEPGRDERVSYIAMTLVSAILNDNENLKLAACAYLGDNISMKLNY